MVNAQQMTKQNLDNIQHRWQCDPIDDVQMGIFRVVVFVSFAVLHFACAALAGLGHRWNVAHNNV